MEFTEIEGMILLTRQWRSSPQDEVQKDKDKGKWPGNWRYERFANHLHGRMSAPDRQHIRQELAMVAEFASALHAAYPNRNFIVSHIPCYAVSFYQLTEDAPGEGVDPLKFNAPVWRIENGELWCETCGGGRSYRIMPVPDPEFPQAQWGVCGDCGDDVLVRSGEVRTLVKADE